MDFAYSSLTIIGCTIENNSYGIKCSNTYLEISDCTIQGNSNHGIWAESASFPTIINNVICNNRHFGVYTDNCENIDIKNNWIYHNGYSYPSDGSGVYLKNSNSHAIVRNNTVVENAPFGIYVYYGLDPCLVNDIIWQNSTNIYSVRGLEEVNASYCCIEGGFDGTGNIDCDPCFVDSDANNFHLKPISLCIDAGDPYADYEDETDIDGDPRVANGRAEIGADEVTKADYNGDEIVNFIDFALLFDEWQYQESNKSLDEDADVDINDLVVFCNNWLWTSLWSPRQQSFGQDMGIMIENTSEQAVVAVVVVETPSEMIVESPETYGDEQMTLDGEGAIPLVWLVYEGNTMPDYGDEITVYIHSDTNLMIMDIIAGIEGDAELTSAMSEIDCNEYGWDNGWDMNPYIDPEGWVEIAAISPSAFFDGKEVNGTIGYFKFRYYTGQISVALTEGCIADNNIAGVPFSTEPLFFGPDPNE